MTTHEVLVKARNLIDRRGYDWYSYGRKGGCPLCPEGAIDLASRNWDHPAKEVVRRFIPTPENYHDAYLSLAVRAASDMVVRREFTKDEVLAWFDAAIAATAPEPDVENVTAAAPLLERVPACL